MSWRYHGLCPWGSMKDMGNFSQVNEVYGTYFPSFPPARSTVEVARLPKDVDIEIEAIAVF